MYIKKLILQHFGKYHNREIELQKGINLIYGPNEAGKTTVRDFIIGMFYGIERSRGVAARTDEYTRREPLEGGGYSGFMELYKDGVRYRVDRSFRKDQKYLKVYQQESGRELEIGDRLSLQGILTDLDKNGYTNTLCISGQGAGASGRVSALPDECKGDAYRESESKGCLCLPAGAEKGTESQRAGE